MPRACSTSLSVLGTLAILVLAADPARADKCMGTKLKDIGKKEAGLLACQSKVAATNSGTGLTACEMKVRSKFSSAFGKAGSCMGDEMTCETRADACETAVAGAMTATFPSKCEAVKRKAAGKLAGRELGCYSKAAAKGAPLDSGCVTKAQGKFSKALGQAGTCPDGGSPQALVEQNCVAPAVGPDACAAVTNVCPVTTCRFLATGETTCWDSSGTVIPCAGTGQDGDIQAGAPLSYTDNGDGTVTDNNTGLVWEKQSLDGSIHDATNLYTWDQAFSVHVAGLNSMNFGCHNDWRLPNVRELASIVNYENQNPPVSPAFNDNCTLNCNVLGCSCTGNAFYWSSTSIADNPASAWHIDFRSNGAATEPSGKALAASVRAVRGHTSCLPTTGQTTCWDSSGTVIPCAGTGQDGDIQAGAPLSYTDNGDGTITDNNTGLVWEKQSLDGSIHDATNLYTWDQAFSVHVAGLNAINFAGHNDWRVANVRELESLANYESQNPSVSAAFNASCVSGCTVTTCSCTSSTNYWSSSTNVADPPSGWRVNFVVGSWIADVHKTFLGFLERAVRGGLTSISTSTTTTTTSTSSSTTTSTATSTISSTTTTT